MFIQVIPQSHQKCFSSKRATWSTWMLIVCVWERLVVRMMYWVAATAMNNHQQHNDATNSRWRHHNIQLLSVTNVYQTSLLISTRPTSAPTFIVTQQVQRTNNIITNNHQRPVQGQRARHLRAIWHENIDYTFAPNCIYKIIQLSLRETRVIIKRKTNTMHTYIANVTVTQLKERVGHMKLSVWYSLIWL